MKKLNNTSILHEMKGAGGGGGGGSGQAYTRTPDTLRSSDTIEVILGLHEGEGLGLSDGLKSMYIGDTPAENSDGSKNFDYLDIFYRPGLPEVSADYLIPKLGGTSNNMTVNVSLASGVAVTRQLVQNQIDAIDIRLAVAQLYTSDDNGTYTRDLQIRLRIKKDTDPSFQAAFAEEIINIAGKTSSTYVKELRIPVPRVDNFYQVEITKLSQDSDTTNATDVAWESIQMVTNTLNKYADTATLQIIAKATNQFSSIPDFWGVYKGKKIKLPSNYNPVTRLYTGTWDGTFQTAWSDNPAWCTYDFIMNNRYGMSATWPLSANKYEFYEAGKWCDQLTDNGIGGLEPRYTFNGLITEPSSAIEMARLMAGTFNSALFDDNNGNIILRCDRDDTPATHLFTPENISAEGFSYSFTDVNTWYNDITVSFSNPALRWNEDRRRVFNQDYIDEFGRIPTDFIAIACKTETEAIRRARHKILTANTEKQIVKFNTNRLGGLVQPFETILVAHPQAGYALSGRVKSLNLARTIVYLRDALFLEVGVTYTAIFVHQTSLISRTVTMGSTGSVTQFNVDSALPDDFPEDCTFSLQQDPGAGIGAPKPYRVLSCELADSGGDNVAITAIEINRNKFTDADIGSTPTVIQYSGLGDPNVIPGPSNVTFVDRFSLIGNEVWTILTVTLQRSVYRFYSGEFLVYSRELDSSNNPIGTFVQRTVLYGDTLVNHPPGKFEFKILPLNTFGQSPSLSSVQSWIYTVSSSATVGIPTGPVTNITHILTATGFIAKWTPPAGQELLVHHYLVKEGLTEETAIILQDNLKTPMIVVDPMTKRNYHIYVYAVSSAGAVSTALDHTIENAAPAPPTNFHVEVGYETILIFYDRNLEVDIVGYRLRFRKVGTVDWLDMDPSGLFDQGEPDTAYEFQVASQDALTIILEDEIWSTPRSARTRSTISVEQGIDDIRSSTTQNLVRNGSFEREDANWTFDGAVIITDPSAPYIDFVTGTTKVLQLGDGIRPNSTALTDSFVVRPLSYYAIGVDVKYDAAHPGESHIFTLNIYDADNNLVYDYTEDEGKIFIEPGAIKSDDWTRVTSKFIVPANAVYGKVLVECRGSGIIFIDGVQAQRGSVATAFNPHVSEELSPEDLGTISNPDSQPPAAPTALIVTASFKSSVLTWNGVADLDLAFYEIFRSTTNALSSSVVVGSSAAPVFADTGLTSGVTYYYWVRAVDSSGNRGAANAGETGGTAVTTIGLTTADYQDLSIVSAKIALASIDDARISSLSAGKITSGTITAGSVAIGTDRFLLSGTTVNLKIQDEAGTTRVLLGKLGTGTYNYGLQIWDQNGKAIINANGLSAGVVDTVNMVDGSITADKIVANAIDVTKLAANSVVASKIVAGAIETDKIAAGAVTADKIFVGNLSAITADLGAVTAGTISAAGLSATYNYWNLNDGAFSVGRADGTQYIRFNPTTGKVEVKGEMILTNGGTVDWFDITNRPVDLIGLNPTDGNKLAGIATGADVTSANISANTNNIGPYTIAQVLARNLDPAAQINQTATTIDGAKITTGSITANILSVSTLSAISANIGTVTAGLIRNAPGTAYVNLDATGSQVFLSCGNGAFSVTADGALVATAGTINGNMMVNGTITAEKIVGNGLTDLVEAIDTLNSVAEAGEKWLVFVTYSAAPSGTANGGQMYLAPDNGQGSTSSPPNAVAIIGNPMIVYPQIGTLTYKVYKYIFHDRWYYAEYENSGVNGVHTTLKLVRLKR